MYKDYRFVNSELYTYFGVKAWIEENGDRDRYLYNFYDTFSKTLLYDYEKMIKEYKYVKNVISDYKNNGKHEETLLNYIFNFKNKWEKYYSKRTPQIYFEDLMVLYNEKFKCYK
jgi:hypothetical protein